MIVKQVLIVLLILFQSLLFGQVKVGSVYDARPEINSIQYKREKFKVKNVIIPSAMIGYGFIALNSAQLKSFNQKIQDRIKKNVDSHIPIDNFTVAVPMVSVYALNLFNIKGEHDLKDRTFILAIAAAITAGTTFGLKAIINEQRPDGSANNSFPSAHTAFAFMGAEFLRQEYKNVSFWYGFSGYTFATATGLLRMYNNRHWFSDVVAGAGVGILSTKIAYRLYSWFQKKLGLEQKNSSTQMITPFYNGKQIGLNYAIRF